MRKACSTSARRSRISPARSRSSRAFSPRPSTYNGFVERGLDEDFGRRHLVHHFGELRPIEAPPFYAYPSTAVVFGTYCGLEIDPQARVLDHEHKPIPRLFAAGEVTGGFHGAAYMTGSALGKALVFGRLAALEIARQ